MKEDKKLARNSKRSRLIIRNLSFNTTEDELKKLFSKYGNIVDLNLPKKSDDNKKIKGFAFISFDNVGSSLKAIKYLNGTKFLNRQIAVDFAVSKDLYVKHQAEEQEKKQPNGDKDSEVNDDDDEDQKNEDATDDDADDQDIDDDDCADDNDDDNQERMNVKQKKPRNKKSDVNEGKTIFIRNLDLDTDEESLETLFKTFGPIEYCRICYDDISGKSKGSAFIKFKNQNDAQNCLKEANNIENNDKFYLDGRQLIVTEAVARNKMQQIQMNNQKSKHKDKRNLYLAKEGLIYPDSPAAVGVSAADLKKRLQLEEKKRKLLQNLHYFISDRRLCIHNLPPNYDDQKLRKLFQTAVNDKSAKILWAKVMRNRSRSDKQKFSGSKGFGFVEFAEHQHALKALRKLNNNPETFTKEKRPIVEFSIENKVALNRKKYRQMKQEKLRQMNENETKSNNNDENNDEINEDEQQMEQESTDKFSGVESRPFNRKEKMPKIRKTKRKLIEQKKRLKQIKKRETIVNAKQQILKRKNFKKSDKSKMEKFSNKKPKIDADEFERKHLEKRLKNNKFTMESQSKSAIVNNNKKRKWYLQ